MKVSKFTITPFWDARVMDAATKQSRVLLTINLNGQQFRVSIKVRCTKAEFNAAMNTRSLNAKELRKVLHHYSSKAENILDKLNHPTKEAFIRLFKADADLVVNEQTSIETIFKVKMAQLKQEGRFGTANNYRDALRKFKSYKSDLYFEAIDAKWLKDFVTFVIDSGNAATTAQIYLRCLKHIFNVAIKDGFIPEKCYPFKAYVIGSTVKSKDVLYPDQIQSLWKYEPKGVLETRAKAYFFFCYFGNGMNFKDMCYLRNRNIKGDILTFIRQKTKRTSKTIKHIDVHLNEVMKKVIKDWGNADKSPDGFLFPIMHKSTTTEHMMKAGNRYKRVTNKALAKIGGKLGFDVHLCLNLARHSFATTLKLNGTPVAFIADLMGHKNASVTEHYMKSLPNENLKRISDTLLPFNTAI